MKKTIDQYLKSDTNMEKHTVRAPETLWNRVEEIAVKKEVSINAIVVAALEKVCEEEGV